MPQITISLSDSEYQKYLDNFEKIRRIQQLHPDWDGAKLLITFNAPLFMETSQRPDLIKAPLPVEDEPLLDGYRSYSHRQFYKEAVREINAILNP